jgi:hypothetical protein
MSPSALPCTPPVFGWMIRGQGALFVLVKGTLIVDLQAPEVQESAGFWER